MKSTKQIPSPKLPRWLPPIVKVHAISLLESAEKHDPQPLFLRLICEPKMENIWRKISDVENKQKLVGFLDFVRQHPSLQGYPDQAIQIPSGTKQRATFNNIDHHAQAILKQLTSLTKAGSAEQAWDLIEAALKRSELYEVGQTGKEKFMQLHEIQTRLQYIQTHISIPMLIETIGLAAMLAKEAPYEEISARQNTPNARKKQFTIDLYQFFVHVLYIEPSHYELAVILNTAFNAKADTISEDSIGKLLKSESK